MNIEEERKAFEVEIPKPECVYWCIEDARYMTRSNHPACIEYQGCYKGWLAAKAHAEEPNRPKCYISYSWIDGKWWVDSAFLKTAFNTKSQAIFHAKDNGYRVVS